MRRVAFHNLGCKVNSYEMDAMLQELKAHGYTIVSFDEQADVYIVNTCTVTNMADRKSRQMLHKAKKTNPEAVVVAVGCYVQADADGVRQDEAVDLIIGNNKKKDLVTILESFLQGIEEESVIDINHTDEYEEMQLTQTQEHTRAYIKIQDGCNQFCSYCLIPYARGRVRSRKKADIISEIKGLINAGYQEFVLTGIHISSYGVDFKEEKENLLTLMQEIDALEGMKRLRLGSFEPRIITQEFVDGLKQLKHLCPHFHLSLQSGCEATLKRMNRHYTPQEYLAGVKRLRAAFVHPAITTDVIVGFPGETEEEFKITHDFLKEVGFYEMHIFKYSKRNGTRAAAMENQVPEPVKTKRSNVLLEMEAIDSANFREYYIGKEVEVLFEEEKLIDGTNYWVGHTKEYVKVAMPCNGTNMENVITNGIITGVLKDELFLFV